MSIFREFAPAKINLTLEVLGKRPDGYHELNSLVAFAGAGDVITLDTGAPRGVSTSGPFAASIAGANLIETTLALIATRAPDLSSAMCIWRRTCPSRPASAAVRPMQRPCCAPCSAPMPARRPMTSIGRPSPCARRGRAGCLQGRARLDDRPGRDDSACRGIRLGGSPPSSSIRSLPCQPTRRRRFSAHCARRPCQRPLRARQLPALNSTSRQTVLDIVAGWRQQPRSARAQHRAGGR